MTDEVEAHITQRYDLKKRLGKGVCISLLSHQEFSFKMYNNILNFRHMVLFGKPLTKRQMKLLLLKRFLMPFEIRLTPR